MVTSRVALFDKIARLSGRAAIAALVIGPALSFFGLVAPVAGFAVFALGLPLAVVGTLASGLVLLRGGASQGTGTRRTLVLCLVVLAAIIGAGRSGFGLPAINDITTDPEDPPTFAKAAELEANYGRDMSYPGAEFAQQQESAYPELGPLLSRWPPGEAVAKAEAALLTLPRTEIIDLDPASGRIEATSTTRVFRFVDDVVVRVRSHGDGSRVDVRSKSRDGRGDLGANAARIMALLEKLR